MQEWPCQVDITMTNLTHDFLFEGMWRDAFAKASKGGQQITFGMFFGSNKTQPLAQLMAGPRNIAKHFDLQVDTELQNMKKEQALSVLGHIVVQDDLSKVASAARSRKRQRVQLPLGSPAELVSALPGAAFN